MNVFPKGAFTVILMTVMASTSILFFGSTIADSTVSGMNADAPSAVAVKKLIEDATDNLIKENGDIQKSQEQANVAPPPGPYFVKKLDLNKPKQPSLEKAPKVQSATRISPVTPALDFKKPILNKKEPELSLSAVISKKPKLKVAAPLEQLEFKRLQPSIPFAPTKPQQIQEAVSKPEMELNQPKLKKTVINEPSAPHKPLTVPALEKRVTQVIPASQPKGKAEALIAPSFSVEKPRIPALKQREMDAPNVNGLIEKKLSMPNQPIWMKKSPIVSLVEPEQPTMQQKIPTFNGLKRPMSQQYIYVPMPVYRPNYRYPPIPPMNNRNFFAPSFNYRAPHISAPVGAFGQNNLLGSQTQNNFEIK